MPMLRAAPLIAILLAPGAVQAADLRIFPSDSLVLNPVYPDRGYFDMMVPTVAVSTRPGERLRVEGARFELRSGIKQLASRTFDAADFVRDSARLAPASFFIDGQFVDAGGVRTAYGEGARIATSADLTGGQILALTEKYFAVDRKPDRLRVTVSGVANGRRLTLVKEVPILEHKSAVQYSFPLKGTWLRASNPTLNSHHRFNPSEEYAVDFFKVDGNGKSFQQSSALAENWYAYGQPVLAAADGEVIRVISDVKQDRSFLAPRPGESDEQRRTRTGRAIEQRVYGPGAHYPDVLTGNLVVVKHSAGEMSEYSAYGHLKAGAIRVHVGDRVKRGEVIAEVGDTGDTPVVHLHFQVNGGPDPFNSKSLPFSFGDTVIPSATRDPGYFTASKP